MKSKRTGKAMENIRFVSKHVRPKHSLSACPGPGLPLVSEQYVVCIIQPGHRHKVGLIRYNGLKRTRKTKESQRRLRKARAIFPIIGVVCKNWRLTAALSVLVVLGRSGRVVAFVLLQYHAITPAWWWVLTKKTALKGIGKPRNPKEGQGKHKIKRYPSET